MPIEAVRRENADILYVMPSHQFPLGTVMPLKQRLELLKWASEKEGRYLIEDDHDSEYRYKGKPIPSLQSIDHEEKVIYLGTFSKSIAPSLRISYMVLPAGLMARFREKLGFYGCTVPSFEQYTLARFLDRGYFEKHINRMRKFYRARRNRVIDALERCPAANRFTILEQDAGLHFLLRVNTPQSGASLARLFAAQGLKVQPLSDFYTVPTEESRQYLVINYSAVDEEKLVEALGRLQI